MKGISMKFVLNHLTHGELFSQPATMA